MSAKALIELVREEMAERGWTSRDVAIGMVAHYDAGMRELEIDLMLALVDEPNIVVGDDTCEALDRTFGVSAGFCRRLVDAPPIIEAAPEVSRETEGNKP